MGKEREWDQNHQKRTAQTPPPSAVGPPRDEVQTQTSEWRRPRSGQVRQGKVEPNKRPQELYLSRAPRRL